MSTEKTSWALIPADQAQKKDDFGTIPWGQTRPQGPAKDTAAVGGQNGTLGGWGLGLKTICPWKQEYAGTSGLGEGLSFFLPGLDRLEVLSLGPVHGPQPQER